MTNSDRVYGNDWTELVDRTSAANDVAAKAPPVAGKPMFDGSADIARITLAHGKPSQVLVTRKMTDGVKLTEVYGPLDVKGDVNVTETWGTWLRRMIGKAVAGLIVRVLAFVAGVAFALHPATQPIVTTILTKLS